MKKIMLLILFLACTFLVGTNIFAIYHYGVTRNKAEEQRIEHYKWQVGYYKTQLAFCDKNMDKQIKLWEKTHDRWMQCSYDLALLSEECNYEVTCNKGLCYIPDVRILND